jgi:RNA polymerase sigma factor (sigma-70 family)
MKDFADLSPRQQQYIEIMINRFVPFSYDNCEYFKGHLLLTESQLMKWMKQTARKYTVEGAMRTFATVDRLFQSLTDRGVASANPMKEFVTRFGRRGWTGIAQALKSKHYHVALSSLRIGPRFTGAFGKQAETYIQIHQAAGARYKANEYILAEFNQFLWKHRIESIREITPSIVLEWVRSQTCQQFTRRGKLLRLAHFFRYLCSLKLVNRNPVTQAVIGSFGPAVRSFAQSGERLKVSGNLHGYLATSVANRVRNRYRAKQEQQKVGMDRAGQVPSDLKTPEQWASYGEELKKVNDALAQVPYEQREVILLHVHGAMRFKVIAESQSVSVNTALSRYRYGIEKLRSVLNSEPNK